MKARYQAAMLALLLTAPALASPGEDSACLIGRLSADDVSMIVAETLAGRSEAVIQRLNGPLEVCSGSRGWVADRRGNAPGYTIGVLLRDTLQARLATQGIDAAVLDRWFARQSSEFRTTAFATMPQAQLEASLATLVGNELSLDAMERNGAAIGGYLSALMILERIERGLGM